MQGIRSKTVTRSAERPWADVSNPIWYTETRMFDYSELVATAGVDYTHPWVRDDKRVIVPSGVPVAVDDGGGDARLVFPVKRTALSANVTNTDTDYPVNNTKPFKVGDTINIASGTPQAITAIDHTNKILTVGTTLGQAGTAGDALWTPDKDTAVGIMVDTVDLTDGTEDVPIGVLVEGYVFPAVIHNSIFEVPAQVLADIKAANIRVVPSYWTP